MILHFQLANFFVSLSFVVLLLPRSLYFSISPFHFFSCLLLSFYVFVSLLFLALHLSFSQFLCLWFSIPIPLALHVYLSFSLCSLCFFSLSLLCCSWDNNDSIFFTLFRTKTSEINTFKNRFSQLFVHLRNTIFHEISIIDKRHRRVVMQKILKINLSLLFDM